MACTEHSGLTCLAKRASLSRAKSRPSARQPRAANKHPPQHRRAETTDMGSLKIPPGGLHLHKVPHSALIVLIVRHKLCRPLDLLLVLGQPPPSVYGNQYALICPVRDYLHKSLRCSALLHLCMAKQCARCTACENGCNMHACCCPTYKILDAVNCLS